MNAIDFGQTITVARRPQGLAETDNETSIFIGHHPSEAQVTAAWAVESTIHMAITGWLNREAEATGSRLWHAVKWAWQAGTVVHGAHHVLENHDLGIPVFGGSFCPPVSGSHRLVTASPAPASIFSSRPPIATQPASGLGCPNCRLSSAAVVPTPLASSR